MPGSKRHILVTGGGGYIGAHIVQQLCDQGEKVVVLDNFSTGIRQNVDPRAHIVEGDVLSKDDLRAVFEKGIRSVFHFAAKKAAGESMTEPAKFAKNNITGTLTLLEAAIDCGALNFVFSSSAAVYGTPASGDPIREDTPKNPDNYYGYTKLAIEQNLDWMSRLKGIRYAALRYFNATGYDRSGRIKLPETDPGNLCPVIMEAAAGMRDKVQVFGGDYPTPDGTGIRDYIHVDDLVTAHIQAMKYICDNKRNLVVNLGTGRGYSVLEMIHAAESVCNQSIPHEIVERRPGDPARLIASSERAKVDLNWIAEYSDIESIFQSMCPVYGIEPKN